MSENGVTLGTLWVHRKTSPPLMDIIIELTLSVALILSPTMVMETVTSNGDVGVSTPWTDLQDALTGANPEDADHLDSVLADAMNSLSFKDREKISHELHGISSGSGNRMSFDDQDSPEFQTRKLAELQCELERIKLEQQQQQQNRTSNLPTAALELAESISYNYVHDSKFQLDFLKCDDWDVKSAAQRMVHYFDFKFGLFGGDKLCKPVIGLEDLDDDDKYALERGFLQVLPIRDRAGRPVAILFPDKQEYAPGCDIGQCFGRVTFFMYSNFLEQYHSADKGVVQIVYSVGHKFDVDRLYPQVPPMVLKYTRAIPTKSVSYHFCFNHVAFRLVIQTFVIMFGMKTLKAMSKAHQGSQQEVMYSLMTYGIPTDQFPVDFKNDIKRNTHMDMLKMIELKQQAADAKEDSSDHKCVILPLLLDVLLGKGGPTRDYPGNMRLKMTVDELIELHTSLDRDSKIELVAQVINTVKETGGRFLSKETGVWRIVSNNVARKCVATMFRNRKKIMAKKAKTNTTTSAVKAPRTKSLDESNFLNQSRNHDNNMAVVEQVPSNKRVKALQRST